jgi:hypothetical protein
MREGIEYTPKKFRAYGKYFLKKWKMFNITVMHMCFPDINEIAV